MKYHEGVIELFKELINVEVCMHNLNIKIGLNYNVVCKFLQQIINFVINDIFVYHNL